MTKGARTVTVWPIPGYRAVSSTSVRLSEPSPVALTMSRACAKAEERDERRCRMMRTLDSRERRKER
jgi:hypothetical protein